MIYERSALREAHTSLEQRHNMNLPAVVICKRIILADLQGHISAPPGLLLPNQKDCTSKGVRRSSNSPKLPAAVTYFFQKFRRKGGENEFDPLMWYIIVWRVWIEGKICVFLSDFVPYRWYVSLDSLGIIWYKYDKESVFFRFWSFRNPSRSCCPVISCINCWLSHCLVSAIVCNDIHHGADAIN